MDGVINIITKHSKDTQGNLLVAGGGNEEKIFGAIRHGGKITDGSYYRFYIKSFEHDNGGSIDNAKTNDLSRGFQGGFRTDIKLTEQDELTFQGDYFEGDEEENLTAISFPQQSIDTKPIQYNVMGRWQHTGTEGDQLALQFYFNREQWDNNISSPALTDYRIDTYDVDFQHQIALIWRLKPLEPTKSRLV
jgi:iron complex outermembrane receptor protein